MFLIAVYKAAFFIFSLEASPLFIFTFAISDGIAIGY